jgi:Uma2 family endonuclease
MSAAPHLLLTPDEYLAFEEASLEAKHEYHDGEIFAMAGASPGHANVTDNLTVAIGSRLRERPCRVNSSDLRVEVDGGASYVYPDVVIVCGRPEYRRNSLLNPLVVFEVLSPSTEGYDRGFKFERYRRIPTLRAYVLLAHDRRHADVFTRTDDGYWRIGEPFTEGDLRLDLPELGSLALPLGELYEDVDTTGADDGTPQA